jgi:hypothetical protein
VKITREWLEQRNACKEGKEWCLSHGELTINELFPIFMSHKKYRWLNWLLVRLMDQKQRIAYAVFADESVLHIFEKKYPDNKRPRQAIESTKTYLENPCEETKKAAVHAIYNILDVTLTVSFATTYGVVDAKKKTYIKILTYGFELIIKGR